MTQWIGFVAGLLTAFAFLPQVLKTWRTRSSGDLSAMMLTAQSTGVALWIVYGIAIGSTPASLQPQTEPDSAAVMSGDRPSALPTSRTAPRVR